MVITLFHYLQTKINTLQKTIQEQHPRKLGIIVVTRLFLLEMCLAVAKYFVLLFKDSYTSFVALCNQPVLKVCPYSYVEHKTFQRRLRLFSVAGFVVLVAATALSSLIVNLTTGPVFHSGAASHLWTQSKWESETVNTTGHDTGTNQPVANWTQYTAKDDNLTLVNSNEDLQVSTQTSTWTVTNDGATDTGFNNSGVSKSQTSTSGSGADANIGLTAQAAVTSTLTQTDNTSTVATPSQTGGWGYGSFSATEQNGTTGAGASVQLTRQEGSWATSIADAGGVSGNHTSIQAINSSTIFISYSDSSGVKFAKSTNGGTDWTTTLVQSAPSTDTSLWAVDADTIFIAYPMYYDDGEGGFFSQLQFAKSTNGGSNWSSSAADASYNVGQYPSIYAVDSNTIFISHYGAVFGDLKFSKSTNGGANWTTSTIDSTNTVGLYSSLQAVDANTIFVSYYVAGPDFNLKFAKSTDGGATWPVGSIVAVDSTGTVGSYSSLDAVDANTIFISYGDSTNTNLKFAKSTDGGATWPVGSIVNVDTSAAISADVYSSVYAVDANTIFISYYEDAANYNLKFAQSTDGGANWNSSTIDSSSNATGKFSSIYAVDADMIFISYFDSTSIDLKFAKYSALFNSSGTYTAYVDGGTGTSYAWNSFSWEETLNGGDISVKVKTASSSASAPSFTSGTCDASASSVTLSDSCRNSSHRYLWYQITLTPSGDQTATSLLNSVTVSADIIAGYYSSGTFISHIFNTAGNVSFGALSWSATLNSGTITMKARTCNDSSCSGETAIASCADVASGTTLSGANSCITDGDQYAQFQATLNSSLDQLQTPSLNDVSIQYVNYPTTAQTLTSSEYNTAQEANIVNKVTWSASSLPANTEVKMQIRSSADGSTWSDWCGYSDSGSTCGGSNYFESSHNNVALASTHPLQSSIFSTPELNDQWIQYKIFLTATASATPTLNSVALTYVINTAPSFNTDYGSGGIAVTDNLDGTYNISFKPKDEDSQDSNNAYPGPGYVCPTFEYYNGSAWGTIPAAALNLDAISAASKNTASTCGSGLPALAVSESAYGDPNNSLQPYIVGWNAESHVSANTYTAGAKVRITAHDGEAANYQTTATYSGTFTIDVAAPSLTSTPAILDASQSPALLTFDTVTEPNTPQMKVGLASDLSDASWETAASTKSVTLPSSASTVYYQFKDSYNNQTSIRSIAPLQSLSGIMVQDITNVKTTPYEYRLFISWQPKTDASAFTNYEVFRSTDSASFSSTPVKTITDITTNYFVDSTATSLVADTTYYYKVRYQDKTNLGADPNRNSISYYTSTIEAKANGVQDFGEGGGGTPADPPTITIGSNPVSGITTQSATITWKTDKLSDSLVEYGTVAGSYALSQGVTSMVSGTEAGSTDHQVTLIGLSPNTTYYFRVKSTDIYNNLRTDDNSGQGYSFATLNGPRISDVRAEDISNTSVKIVWNTDRDSSSYVVYSINSDMTDSQEAGTSTSAGGGGPNYYHTVSVSSLTTGTTYYYYVKSIDSENNTAVNNNGLTYYTLKTTSDTTAPAISNITVSTTTPDTAVITWTTNEPATSVAEYGISAFESTSSDTTLAISHVVALTNLQPETTYTFRITSSDSSGNESVSDNQTLATLKESEIKTDQTAPTITNISVGGITSNSAIVTFTTNETCLDSINYGTTTSYNKGVTDVEAGVSHSIKINDLSPSTPYHFQVYCRDSSGNVGSSSDQTFTTLAPTATGEGGKTEAEKRIEGLINENFSPEDLRDAIKKLQSPPIITGTGPEVSEIRSNSAKVEWKTDKKANCILIYSNNESKITGFKAKPGSVDTTDGLIEVSDTEEQALAHELVLTNLTPGTTYYFMAGSKDVYGNLTLSDKKSFSTLVVPMISGVEISNTTLSSVAISWNTSVVTTGFIEYGKDINYGSTKEYDDKTTKGTKHSLVLSNLDPTTTYHFRIKGTSSSDSSLISSEDYTFNTQALPTISKEEIKKITDNSAKITFETNIETDTQVLYKPLKKTSSTIPLSPGETEGDSEVKVISYQSKGKPDLTKNHEIILENLEFGTDYDIKIKVKDAFDNTTEKQLPTFTTGIDLTPPAISVLRTENALIPGKKDKVQTIISWKTDEPSTTQIMYQEGIDLKRTDLKEKTSEDKNFTKDHVIVLTNLKPGTVYQLKAISKDNQNNETVSNNQTMLTPKQQESVFQVIMKNLEDVFGWVKKIR